MQSKATTVKAYLDSLPEDRRQAVSAVRQTILDNLDEGFREGVQYGMIGYCVPHEVYPAGYHCDPRQPLPFAGLASQKGHMALYLHGVYTDQEARTRLVEDWKKSGKKLNMGAACIRFKKLEDLPLDVIGRAVERSTVKKYIAAYEAALAARPSTAKKAAAMKKKVAKKITKQKAPQSKASRK